MQEDIYPFDLKGLIILSLIVALLGIPALIFLYDRGVELWNGVMYALYHW